MNNLQRWLLKARLIIKRHPIRTAYIVGVLYYSYQISWLRGIRSADLVTGSLSKFIGLTPFLITIFIFSFAPALFMYIYGLLKLSITQFRFVFLAPFLWVVCESFVSVSFSIISSGIGSRVGDYWHFGSIGIWIIPTPLVFLSRWGGLYVLSFSVALLLCSIIFMIKTKKWIYSVSIIASLVVLSVLSYQLYKTPNGQSIVIAAIGSKVLKDDEYVNNPLPFTVQKVPEHSLDVIVLPEYSRYWEYDKTKHTTLIQRALKDSKGLVIDSYSKVFQNKKYNNITYSSSNGTSYNEQSKWFIVPGGEYIPYIYRGPLRMLGQAKTVRAYENTRSVTPGTKNESPYVWKDVAYGALACSAANAPELYREITNRGAEVLINTASLGTIGLSKKYHDTSFLESRLHAIANARPFIQSARGGYNFVLDSNGRVLTKDTTQGNNFVTAKVSSNKRKTIYTVFGNWIVVLSYIITVYSLLRIRRNKPHNLV